MELTPKQQTIELIKNASKILLLTHINPDGDALGSLLALYLALKKLDKKVAMAVPDLGHGSLKFLPSRDEVGQEIKTQENLIITLDTSRVEDVKLGYRNRPAEKKIDVLLSPVGGQLCTADISFNEAGERFDLIVVLDTPDLDRLGSLYEKNAELFYKTPVTNIDHHPSNDHFGKVNWVEITATSTAEVLVSLLESLGRETPLLDADIATALLTGIITDTNSFQNSNTTPKSFTVAAQLVAAGARQQEIVRSIYKTKNLSTLKIWGKILSKVIVEPERFVWSVASARDLVEVGAEETETSGVVDELLNSTTGVGFALLLTERSGGLHGSLRSVEKGVNVCEIARLFAGGGHEQAAAFYIPGAALVDKQEEILKKIKEYQGKREVAAESAHSVEGDAKPVSKW